MSDLTYPIADTFPGGLDLAALSDAIKASAAGQPFVGASTSGDTLTLAFQGTLDPAQLAALQAVVAVQNDLATLLRRARELRFGEIDAKTDQIFGGGFEYPGSGVWLSLSSEAQSRMIGLMVIRDQATYPIRWNALDDATFVDLAGPSDVIALFGSGAAALRSYVDGGTAIKNEIRAATTVAAVMAVVDPR